MNRDVLSKIIGLVRYANAMGKLSAAMRADIFMLEKEFKEMLQRHWSYIMLHHSLTKDGKTVSGRAIRKWHMGLIGSPIKGAPDYNPYIENPMDDIGYHFWIEMIGGNRQQATGGRQQTEGNRQQATGNRQQAIGNRQEGEYEILMGRPLDRDGAHCPQKNMNSRAIGICFVGNFDEGPVPQEQWKQGIVLVRSLTRLLDIPISFVVGHRDFAPKSCPGKLFDLERFRKEVASA